MPEVSAVAVVAVVAVVAAAINYPSLTLVSGNTLLA